MMKNVVRPILHHYKRETILLRLMQDSMFLYDIVQAYLKVDSYWDSSLNPYDETLEQLWNAQEAPKDYDDILVIRDGSGSMYQKLLVIVLLQL